MRTEVVEMFSPKEFLGEENLCSLVTPEQLIDLEDRSHNGNKEELKSEIEESGHFVGLIHVVGLGGKENVKLSAIINDNVMANFFEFAHSYYSIDNDDFSPKKVSSKQKEEITSFIEKLITFALKKYIPLNTDENKLKSIFELKKEFGEQLYKGVLFTSAFTAGKTDEINQEDEIGLHYIVEPIPVEKLF